MNRTLYLTICLLITLNVSGCWRFDWTKFPLYDEIFVKQEEELDTRNRKPPTQNPNSSPEQYGQ